VISKWILAAAGVLAWLAVKIGFDWIPSQAYKNLLDFD